MRHRGVAKVAHNAPQDAPGYPNPREVKERPMRNKDRVPQARQDRPAAASRWELSPQALERWNETLVPAAAAAAASGDNTISILDPIGQDYWTGEGVTTKRIAAALRMIGADKDVIVNINSPGGDLFEGLAIYNLLRDHGGKVTVRIIGIAASAASIIAMAGDEIQIARAGFLMIHKTWVVAIGNADELRDMATVLDPFDFSMADIYTARAALEAGVAMAMMKAETWIGGAAAIEQGFADALLPADQIASDPAKARTASHQLEMALLKAGCTRSERRALLQGFKDEVGTPGAVDDHGKPGAPGTGKPRAAGEDGKPGAAESLTSIFDSFRIPQFEITTP